MRISDAERHRVAEVLREAAGEGRLDLDELDERLELTFAAKTYADPLPITADLHAVHPAPPPSSPVPRADLGPDSPTIRVRGLALMGSVQVVRLPPPGTPRKILGTY